MEFEVGDKVKIKDNLQEYERYVLGVDTSFFSDITSTVYTKYNPPKTATIKVDGIEQRLEIYEEGEANLMKILDIYKDNRVEEINQKYSKEREEILEKDEIVKDIQKINKKIAKTDFKPISYETRMTEETQKLLNDNEATRKEEIVKIDDLVEEVTAQLELCETYEQKIQVLINYGIIDKETKKVK